MSSTSDHPHGGYRYVPGISPYSAGVSATGHHHIRHVTLRQPRPWRAGLELADEVLASFGCEPQALCSVELRSPQPHSFGGFGTFNDDYRQALTDRAILLDDGTNPVARTNVAPCAGAGAVTETELYGFGFIVPGLLSAPILSNRPSFIVSGAGDLYDQADLRPESIVGGSTPWAESAVERATVVLGEIEQRMSGLGVAWEDTDSVVVYSAEPIHPVLESVILARLGDAARRGVQWQLARPPIDGLCFEMDARGGVEEIWL